MAPKSILTNCNGFIPLEHRNQRVGFIKGVAFINDSKATNVDATRYSLKTHKNVHLILGGQAKENNFHLLLDSMENVSRIYLIGEAASLIARTLEGHKVERFNTLNKAFFYLIDTIIHLFFTSLHNYVNF